MQERKEEERDSDTFKWCVCVLMLVLEVVFFLLKNHTLCSVCCMYGQLFATAFPLEATKGFLLLGQRPTNMITCLFSRSRGQLCKPSDHINL